MKLYRHLHEAQFLSRPNRFIALCRLNGEVVTCHVKNTGRCRELLLPEARVWLEESDQPARKTRYDLVCVQSRSYVVNVDSQAPNRLFAEWAAQGGFLPGITQLTAERVYGSSRFDFAYERIDPSSGRLLRGFTEVKGVTLFDDSGTALFPDAPTERGVKHLHELLAAHSAGYEASVCFVCQRDDVTALRPNDLTHPAFGDALRQSSAGGVSVRAVCCNVTPECCAIVKELPVILDE